MIYDGWSLTQSVAPTETPITLDEIKERLRIDHNDSDAELMLYIEAATDYCQEYQWAQYCTATIVERMDRFPSQIILHKNPVQSVSSVVYVDSAGNSQTLTANTDYTVDQYSKPARIVPAYSKVWPTTRGHINDVVVTYVSGFGSASSVPAEVRLAIAIKAGQMFGKCENQSDTDKVIHSLLDKQSFRVFF